MEKHLIGTTIHYSYLLFINIPEVTESTKLKTNKEQNFSNLKSENTCNKARNCFLRWFFQETILLKGKINQLQFEINSSEF